MPSALLRDPRALAGKVVIDCNNRDVGDDRRPGEFRFDTPPPVPSHSQRLAADVPQARVVKAFNTVAQPVIEIDREQLARHRVSVFVCGDDPTARATVKSLAEELGFVGVDCGPLASAWLVDALADFIRYQIGPMRGGPFTTISLGRVSRPDAKG
jgi:predicted dinucleotide-binding enzyme